MNKRWIIFKKRKTYNWLWSSSVIFSVSFPLRETISTLMISTIWPMTSRKNNWGKISVKNGMDRYDRNRISAWEMNAPPHWTTENFPKHVHNPFLSLRSYGATKALPIEAWILSHCKLKIHIREKSIGRW